MRLFANVWLGDTLHLGREPKRARCTAPTSRDAKMELSMVNIVSLGGRSGAYHFGKWIGLVDRASSNTTYLIFLVTMCVSRKCSDFGRVDLHTIYATIINLTLNAGPGRCSMRHDSQSVLNKHLSSGEVVILSTSA